MTEKDKAIKEALASIENRVRHVYNKGIEDGRKAATAPEDAQKIMPLACLKCKKSIPLTMPTFREVGYTKYSYCTTCLRKGLKALKAYEDLQKTYETDKARSEDCRADDYTEGFAEGLRYAIMQIRDFVALEEGRENDERAESY